MESPCEFAVKFLYPIVRAKLSRILVNKYHLTQMEIAEKLGITQAAVSQYVNEKRGAHLKDLPPKVKKLINNMLNDFISKWRKEDITGERVQEAVCKICNEVKKIR
ncbi:MAG: transcriptional regulator [Candidatus Odinarchaeia archaeon]